MKPKHLLLALFLSSGLIGCQNAGPNTQQGAVIGALGGAAVGGVIGHQSGRALEGAAIGAAAGGVGGAAIGNAQDQENERRRRDAYYNNY